MSEQPVKTPEKPVEAPKPKVDPKPEHHSLGNGWIFAIGAIAAFAGLYLYVIKPWMEKRKNVGTGSTDTTN